MRLLATARRKSPWIIHYSGAGCNGCGLEMMVCFAPPYDVERFGVLNVGHPKHADILIVTGAVNHKSQRVLANLYQQMPEPRLVMAVGACACTGGVFQDCYNVLGGVDGIIPVDVYVPGCAARPEAIIDGLRMLADKLSKIK